MEALLTTRAKLVRELGVGSREKESKKFQIKRFFTKNRFFMVGFFL
jgi:hypothetical protein